MTDFDVAAALTPSGPGVWTAQIPADWTQGRTTFGGLVAALAVHAVSELVGDRPLRSIDVAFIGVLPPGPVRISAEVLSAGRSISQVSVDLRDAEGTLASRVFLVAGAARTSQIVVPGPAPFDGVGGSGSDPESAGIEFPYIDGVTPVFTQNMALRWCGEHFPFTGAGPEGAVIRAWVRHRTAATGLGAVVALIDTAPPVILPMAPGPAPASTVRWSSHLVWPEVGTADASGWFWLETDAVHARDGYAIEQTRLFSGGQLVAWSEQSAVVYDKPPAARA